MDEMAEWKTATRIIWLPELSGFSGAGGESGEGFFERGRVFHVETDG